MHIWFTKSVASEGVCFITSETKKSKTVPLQIPRNEVPHKAETQYEIRQT